MSDQTTQNSTPTEKDLNSLVEENRQFVDKFFLELASRGLTLIPIYKLTATNSKEIHLQGEFIFSPATAEQMEQSKNFLLEMNKSLVQN